MGYDAEALGAPLVPSRAERLALRLYPRRSELLSLGIAGFVGGALPLAAAARGLIDAATWQLGCLVAGVLGALWAIGLVNWAVLLHPTCGLVGRCSGDWRARHRWLFGVARGYAGLTLCAFALSPLWIWIAATE